MIIRSPDTAAPSRSKTGILTRYIAHILPHTGQQLKGWQQSAGQIPDLSLRTQALASLEKKAFHCQGGAVFAVDVKNDMKLLKFIVAYQTLCDYLDNLCDRAGTIDGDAFFMLHQSLLDSLDDSRECQDYYRYYPGKDDGGYILSLVRECRRSIQLAPVYERVQNDVIQLAGWYCQLQVAKHLESKEREAVLRQWVDELLPGFSEIYWQEFAAATGSTLGIFAMMRWAFTADGQDSPEPDLLNSYFPWISALHILLDYLIDQEEDKAGGDLNFVSYYPHQEEMMARLTYILSEAYQHCDLLADKVFHETVIDGLLAMYMSDRKVEEQGLTDLRTRLLNQGSRDTWRTYRLCKQVRRFL